MPLKIILPKDRFIVLAATLDGANPVVLAMPMCRLNITY